MVALNLRPSIAAVGSVLQQIGTTFGYTPATLGILTAIPLVAFAVASPLVTPLAARLGSDHTMLIALLAIAVGNAMRTFGAAPGLWLGTVLFSSACITTGSAVAGLTASPLADYAHSWQLALGMWALPALLTAALWVWRMYANYSKSYAGISGIYRNCCFAMCSGILCRA